MEVENIAGKRGAGRFPIWACIALFVVLFFLLMGLYAALVGGILSFVLGVDARHPGIGGYIVMEAGMLLAALTAAAIMLYFERRPFSELGLSVKGHARGLGYGLLVAVLIYLTGFGVSWMTGEVEVTGFKLDPIELLDAWVFCLLVALCEEILMRGYILGHLLHTHLNKFLSLFLSAVLFALFHLFNPNISFLPMLNLILAGMLLGASYLYTRNLCFPVSLHLFWNWIQGPVLGYQVSGNDFMTSVLTLRLPEDNVWNGRAFGFEGSLICTILMIVFTILIIWWGEKREAISLAVSRSC